MSFILDYRCIIVIIHFEDIYAHYCDCIHCNEQIILTSSGGVAILQQQQKKPTQKGQIILILVLSLQAIAYVQSHQRKD